MCIRDRMMSLSGMRAVHPAEAVCHISYFEADAYARWAGKRLPSEAEWENSAASCARAGNFVETEIFHPLPAPSSSDPLTQMFGNVWEWTQSPYTPYPG